ncbi:hypothetical protein HO554_02240 [Streptococcus suis]|uniref:hypothetical protein n=1 Tax=Streptococcus suis TaxID=1307 RepID=UPI0015527CF1|nr:hypothetical protein [Streptococcus suis]NQG58557.1 hypothetical protein [Streptococcus suis]NQJ47374.1 hypothetical protein [Streptococcus suis]HEM5218220.1 hypothetical protein [Streptococcus suis]HEM6221762.1 hypothetical protein [Streptococcus suis]
MKLGQIDLQMCKDFDIIQRCWIRRPTAIIVFQKPLSVCWGLFCYPNFKKIAFFQNLIEKYLLLSRTFLKIAVFADKKRPCPEVLSIPSAFFNTFFIDCWQIE